MSPHRRVSDTDRQRTVDRLVRHVGTGWLSLDEFDRRATRACTAGTAAELAALTADLPGSALPATPTRNPLPLVAVTVTALALLVLVGAVLAGWPMLAHTAGQIAARCGM